MHIPIRDPNQAQRLLASGDVKRDPYNMPVLLSQIMHFLLDPVIGDRHKITTDIALYETFMKIAKTEECIPCVDAKKTLSIRLDNRFTEDPTVTANEEKRLLVMGFPAEELEQLKRATEQEIEIERANAEARNEVYQRPPFFPLSWNNQKVQYLRTPLDKTTGEIWSIAIMIPHELPPELHAGHFITVLRQLFAEMPLSKKTRKVVYAYSITQSVKFNFFITFK